MADFGMLLSSKRNEAGLSLQQLQEELWRQKELKVSRSFLNILEKGNKKPPYDLTIALAVVLDIDVKEALRAAYFTRVTYDYKREQAYLQKALERNKLTSIKLDKIAKQPEID